MRLQLSQIEKTKNPKQLINNHLGLSQTLSQTA